MTCASCGTLNAAGAKFCSECGEPLFQACASCARPLTAGAKFCSECGTPVGATSSPASTAAMPQAERRLVTVLFADLVGFTAASEGRDAEDTRELLTRYFDVARTTIERYGGTVEKFIGDAVMAVWGAPPANEDDAERAVRAALELVDAVPTLDAGLAARAGLLTGEAAVTLGADGQGMVAGDLVNTASRIQSAAEPGSVLVGEATRRASEAAIVYESAGEHDLKGKSEPVPLFRPVRVVANRGGEGRATGFEAPFVGRSTELRLVKDLFHASVDESRARLVSVVGIAGIGKSRLSWELEKYIDGLATDIWWHRGRCLSYGDGVAFWALAEMVRGRARILEDEDSVSAAEKLRATIDAHVADPAEREWIEPRLRQLLGLTDRTAPDREDLFSAWRRFFERLAEQGPLVMVFEDLHWADEGLVAFVQYLLDWGRHLPIFVITLSRPEIADRHPGFPGSTRSATTLALEPLDDQAMDDLLSGLVPGLPHEVRSRLREAAEGVPLYAVETVRMLRDRGVLDQVGNDVVVTGDLGALEVPETLHALIAARLDAIPEAERRLLQDAAVLGKAFTARALESLSGLPREEVDRLVTELMRKELLTQESDPFSPERGQLAFLQALVQRVTYGTIARRERRSRHLAAARFLATEAGIDPDEIAEVIASHYLDAHEADPEASDRDDVRAEARAWFTRAAERAASLAASLEAQRSFVRAADLAVESVERGRSLARAGELAVTGGRFDEAEPLLRRAIEILVEQDAQAEAARAESRLGEVLMVTNRLEEGVELLERALDTYTGVGDEAAIATVSTQLGRLLFFEGRRDEAMPHVERGLELGERLRLAEVVVEALNNKALILQRRPNESLGLMRQALVLAQEAGIERGALRAHMNLSYLLWLAGRPEEANQAAAQGLELARRRGDRMWERNLASNLVQGHVTAGGWDEALALADEFLELAAVSGNPVLGGMVLDIAFVALRRGDAARAATLAGAFTNWGASADVTMHGTGTCARTLQALAESRYADAVRIALTGLRDPRLSHSPAIVEGLVDLGGEAARAGSSTESLSEMLDALTATEVDSPSLVARQTLQRARLAALLGDDDPPFAEATAAFRVVQEAYWIAVALLDHGTWLVERDRADEAEPMLAEARDLFERMGATPRLEELDAIATPVRT